MTLSLSLLSPRHRVDGESILIAVILLVRIANPINVTAGCLCRSLADELSDYFRLGAPFKWREQGISYIFYTIMYDIKKKKEKRERPTKDTKK